MARYPTPPPTSALYSIVSPSSSHSRDSQNGDENDDDISRLSSSVKQGGRSSGNNGREGGRGRGRGRSPTPKETSSSVPMPTPTSTANMDSKESRMKNKRKRKTKKRKKCNSNPTPNCFQYYYSVAMLFLKCVIFSVVVTFVIFYYILDCKEEVQMLLEEMMPVVRMPITTATVGSDTSGGTLSTTYGAVCSYLSSLWISITIVFFGDKGEKKNSFQYNSSSNYIHAKNKNENDDLDYVDRDNTKIYDMNHVPPYCKEKGALSIENSEHKQSSTSPDICRAILTDEMKASFEKDGVIAIRGLLSPELFRGLNESSYSLMMDQMNKVGLRPSSGKQFFMNKMGAVFTNDDNTTTSSTPLPSSNFRDVALSSLIPQVVSELLGMQYIGNNHKPDGDEELDEENLRMLRDVLLIKDSEKFICGWHVDDLGFWPSTGTSPGVNAWIAIDDMSSSTGGNFAVSVGTHNVPWRHDIYELTGSTMTIPEDGYKDVKDMFEKRKGEGTCNIKNVHKGLHDNLEARKRVYNLKAGDIMFLTRWLFHRTIPYDRDIVKEKKKRGELDQLLSRRYSVRYAPGNIAELPKGYGTELSIMWDEQNQGRTLNSVGANDSPWYPKCWPHSISNNEQKQIQDLIEKKLPVAEARRKLRVNEMKPYLQAMGKQQRDKLRLNAKNVAGRNQLNEL